MRQLVLKNSAEAMILMDALFTKAKADLQRVEKGEYEIGPRYVDFLERMILQSGIEKDADRNEVTSIMLDLWRSIIAKLGVMATEFKGEEQL